VRDLLGRQGAKAALGALIEQNDRYRQEIARQGKIIGEQGDMIAEMTRKLVEAQRARASDMLDEFMQLAYNVSGDPCPFDEWKQSRLDDVTRGVTVPDMTP
jgi:uncharacterized protein YfcZ (UPF0381/DUF406 family)